MERAEKLMERAFPANVAVCPKCHSAFPHNKVNGMAVIEAIGNIDARKRMYLRLTLDGVERLDLDEIAQKAIRKVIFDNFNDFNRDIQTMLGFGEDELE